jgi:sulfite reductase (NADPH) flavoprotein alpha-component
MKANPLSEKQLLALNELTKEITPEQIIWLSGFLEGKISGLSLPLNTSVNGKAAAIAVVTNQPQSNINLTILYGSETGNSKTQAEKLAEKASFKNINATVFSMYDYNYKKLKDEENVAIVVSTHGEGDPPDMAEDFHKFIVGKRAPKLPNLTYSVLALGDKSYKYFCKTGEDIDAACKAAGAFRLTPLVKCDVDYEESAEIWMNNFLLNLTPAQSLTPTDAVIPTVVSQNVTTVADSEFSKKSPYMATVLEKVKITGRDSDKEVYHLELSLEGSGITYEPGDAVGIFTKNPESLVNLIIEKTGFNPDQNVDIKVGEVTLLEALSFHLEITILSFDILKKYFERTKNEALGKLMEDDKLLDEYLYGHDVLDLLEDFPFDWNINKFVEMLRPMPARLYSISSSMESVGEEVHATISVVRYERKNRLRAGACSSHLADNIEIDDQIPIYIERNPLFKLPLNGSKIIMVGAGTGIAPYRAFMQEREVKGIEGKSWLFFGDRRFNADFLYQIEWQKLLKSKHLEKMEVAFSRDQEQKIYVQHKLLENQKELYKWIEEGAYFYLCGDMRNMAKDVNKTLLQIIQNEGGISEEKAHEYVKKLKKEKRFQADIY